MEHDFLKSVLAVRKLEAEVGQTVQRVRQAHQATIHGIFSIVCCRLVIAFICGRHFVS